MKIPGRTAILGGTLLSLIACNDDQSGNQTTPSLSHVNPLTPPFIDYLLDSLSKKPEPPTESDPDSDPDQKTLQILQNHYDRLQTCCEQIAELAPTEYSPLNTELSFNPTGFNTYLTIYSICQHIADEIRFIAEINQLNLSDPYLEPKNHPCCCENTDLCF